MKNAGLLVFFVIVHPSLQWFSYSDQKNWPEVCKTGKNQSPIDLGANKVEKLTSTNRFIFTNYFEAPVALSVMNKNHLVVMRIKETHEMPKISGGELQGDFVFEQLHLHWGSNTTNGSEHLIKGQRYPAELHLIHVNTKYGLDIASAICNSKGAPDTLAVLGILLEVGGSDNVKLADLLENLQYARDPTGDEIFAPKPFKLANLLPKYTMSFYRYNGSLTMPDCSEMVSWTIFMNPLKISRSQFDTLLQIKDLQGDLTEGPSVNNFRDVQPQGDRRLLEYNKTQYTKANVTFIILTVSISILKYYLQN